jgi:hypothetical protein
MVWPVALELGDGLFVLASAHGFPLDNAGFRRFPFTAAGSPPAAAPIVVEGEQRDGPLDRRYLAWPLRRFAAKGASWPAIDLPA